MRALLESFHQQDTQYKRLIVLILMSFSLFLCTSLFYQLRTIVKYPATSDFSAYYAAYMTERELGEGIYDRGNFDSLAAAENVPGGVRPYLYPPFFAETLSVFMPSNYLHARMLWAVLEHVALFAVFLLSALLIFRLSNIDPLFALLIPFAITIGFSAFERSVYYGQASAVMAAILALSVYLHHTDRKYFGAFFAAIATIMKIYPVVYVGGLLLKGEYKAAIAFTVSCAIIILLFLGVFGLANWQDFVSFQSTNPLVDRNGFSESAIRVLYEEPNYSPTALIFLLSDQFGWGLTQQQIWTFVKVTICLGGIGLIGLLWKRITREIAFFYVLSLGFCAAMLVSPLLWNHVFILLIPTYAVLGSNIIADPERNSYKTTAYMASLFLIAFPDFLTNLGATNQGIFVLIKYTKLYGLIILSLLLITQKPFPSQSLRTT